MEQSDLLVRRIRDGTVIDHINEGSGLKVLEALGIDGSSGNVITVALNMPSGKLNRVLSLPLTQVSLPSAQDLWS